MPIRLPLFFSVFIILAAFGFQTGMKPLNVKNYSLKYPATWECVKATDTFQVDYYFYPPEDHDPSFNENLITHHADLNGNKTTLAEFNTRTKENQTKNYPDITYLSDKDIKVKNLSAHELVYSFTYNKMKIKVKRVFMLQYGFMYELIFTSKLSTYDKYIKDVNLVIDSFKPNKPVR